MVIKPKTIRQTKTHSSSPPRVKEKPQPENPKAAMLLLASPPTCCSFHKVIFKRCCIQIFCFFQKRFKAHQCKCLLTSVNALKISLIGPTVKQLRMMKNPQMLCRLLLNCSILYLMIVDSFLSPNSLNSFYL